MYVVVPGGSRNKQVKSIVHNNMCLKICTVVIHRSPEVYKLEESTLRAVMGNVCMGVHSD